ncbi:hypothetical protein LOZ53_002238 [Ophidiomyces ophidiicola]|nr:hypothetical protein LOZ55_004813 [Ophidiomyces ophidiicola]KAI1993192.1 hypothetical protein LOZ53_002238 [Ophidiomyces ophidiicola]KAI1995187.1 hypothetical protein LOZ54_000685 [Ophidiomyces ophidiicola]
MVSLSPLVLTRPVFRRSRQYHASPSLGRSANDLPVITSSLKETLEAHRSANRFRLIRRVLSTPENGDKQEPSGIERARAHWEKQKLRESDLSIAQNLTEIPEPPTSERLHAPSRNVKLPARGHGAASFFQRLTKSSLRRLKLPSITNGLQYPWVDYLDTSGTNGISRLEKEIKAFEMYMAPIPQETAAANKVISDVTDKLRGADCLPLHIIGPRAVGLTMRDSSIELLTIISDPDDVSDIRRPSPTRPKITELQLERQEQLSRLLRGTALFSSVDLIRSRVPVIDAVHAATNLPMTFHCATQLPSSLQFVKTYQSEFPTLRPLLAVLRMMLQNRRLFGVKNRTIDVHTLTMMIVAALKLSEGKYSRVNVAEQLLHIIHFYSTINFRRYGISVDPPSVFRKRGPLREAYRRIELRAPFVRGQISIGKRSAGLGSHMLCLQDPANYLNDLGMTCFRTLELQNVFRDVYEDLKRGIMAWDKQPGGVDSEHHGDQHIMTTTVANQAENSATAGLLDFALGGKYDYLERMRDKIILGTDG